MLTRSQIFETRKESMRLYRMDDCLIERRWTRCWRKRKQMIDEDWRLGSGYAFCDSLSLTVVLLNDLGVSFLESQNREPDPGFGFAVLIRSCRLTSKEDREA